MPDKKQKDEHYTEEETIARAEAALKHMLMTPHQPHSKMKLGKRKTKAGAKASRPEKCRRPSKKLDRDLKRYDSVGG